MIERRRIGNRDITESQKRTIEINTIRDYFNNRLLIIDEVHNLRDESETHSKDTLILLDKILKYNQNMRLLILSATPLFNQAKEIIWIMNMLLKNDKRPTIREKDVFINNYLTETGKEILNKKCRGYISYLRGENPVSFPLRIYPDMNKDLIVI